MEKEKHSLTQAELDEIMWNSLPWWRKEQLLRQTETGKDEIIKQKDKEIATLKTKIERKDWAIDAALDYLDDHRLGNAKDTLKNALSEEE